MKFHVVTTMNEAGWEQTGRRMATSFYQHWPYDATGPLTIYAEGFEPDLPGLDVRKLPAWLDEFKERNKVLPRRNGMVNGRYTYTQDGVKFAHKVAAITDFGLGLKSGIMIWLDADIYTHGYVRKDWLAKLITERAYMAWLDRFNVHPECGFLMFRCDKECHVQFMEAFRNLYTSDDVFRIAESHDSFALQHLVRQQLIYGKIPHPTSLSGPAFRSTHPLVNGPLSVCFDHLKGSRKQVGRTPKEQRYLLRDGNPYWS